MGCGRMFRAKGLSGWLEDYFGKKLLPVNVLST